MEGGFSGAPRSGYRRLEQHLCSNFQRLQNISEQLECQCPATLKGVGALASSAALLSWWVRGHASLAVQLHQGAEAPRGCLQVHGALFVNFRGKRWNRKGPRVAPQLRTSACST